MEFSLTRNQTKNKRRTNLERVGSRKTTFLRSLQKQRLKQQKLKKRQDAFHRKDYQMAIDAYTQAIDFDPTDHTLFSNRSICWLRLGQAEHALSDAKACRELKPDWPKACFREGAALRLLHQCFLRGSVASPESKELIDAFREAVDAGRKFHGKDKITDKS
ncbi:ankyrin repeat family protein [Raphanus sativus]|nr:ankyrin repeat family protein [Raphanus sativus]